MTLHRLRLENFRNIVSQTVDFNEGINVVAGPNAQGKTNLLEAIAYWSAARNFRTVHEEEMVRSGQDRAFLSAELASGGREQRLESLISRSGKRRLSQNGVPLRTVREMMGVLPSVLFAPADLNLVREGPGNRRRLMDMALCQLYPTYITALSHYNKIQRQKQKLLGHSGGKKTNADLLTVYNGQLARYGAILIARRARLVREFQTLAPNYHSQLSRGKEALTLQYKTVSAVADPLAAETEIYQCLLSHFSARLPQEMACGFCLTGPQRDNILLYLDKKELRVFGSQGQARTAAVALKMAERAYLTKELSEPPLLLLDDVLSELDEGRRRMILNQLNEGQIFITGCEKRRLKFSQGRIIKVKEGRFS